LKRLSWKGSGLAANLNLKIGIPLQREGTGDRKGGYEQI
jgi:hypothetical protein